MGCFSRHFIVFGTFSVRQDIPLDWWPLTRDCLAYGFTVAVLICIIHDERVEWYEALILVLLYIVYIGVMYFDKTIQKWAKGKQTAFFSVVLRKHKCAMTALFLR